MIAPFRYEDDELPVRMKAKTPKQVTPRSQLRREGLVEAFKASHEIYRNQSHALPLD